MVVGKWLMVTQQHKQDQHPPAASPQAEGRFVASLEKQLAVHQETPLDVSVVASADQQEPPSKHPRVVGCWLPNTPPKKKENISGSEICHTFFCGAMFSR